MIDQDITAEVETRADELTVEQLQEVVGGAHATGGGGGAGKVAMQDLHFLLPAV